MPAIEFVTINNADVAAVNLGSAHFSKRIIGLKNIPPPIPTTPEIKPTAPPVGNAIFILGRVYFKFPSVSDSNFIISRNAAEISAIVRSKPYICFGIWIIPPMNAKGMEDSKKGIVSLKEKNPER